MKKTILFVLLFCGCLPQQKLTGRLIDTSGPVTGAAVLGMVWVEDAGKALPSPETKGITPDVLATVLDKDMAARGLPAAYSRAFSDKDGRFTLEKLHFSAATTQAIKAMKQPQITRITMWAFQRGYSKQAVTLFPKPGHEKISPATMLLARPENWKELYVENTVDSLTLDYMVKGYSKEFGATKEEKDWILEYTHSNLWKAYVDSDIKGDREMAELCGRDYSATTVSTAGLTAPQHESCAELKKRMGAVRDIEELWIAHTNKREDPLAAAKEVVKRAIALLPAAAAEPKEYESMILAGIEDAANAKNKGALTSSLGISWEEDAKLRYGSGNKAAAYRVLGGNIYAQLPAEVKQGELTAMLSATTIPGIKDTAAGFYLLMNRPLTAQLPNGDNGNHKDKPKAEVKETTGTAKETPLKRLDREFKQVKATETIINLLSQLETVVPETEEDVTILGQMMDKYPSQGQKALAKIKDPKLAKAVMKECDRQVAKFRADKDKDWKTLPEAQRQEKFNALLNSHAIIATLGDLNNKEVIPYLKRYITPEYNGTLSYAASQALGRLGDETVLDEMVRDIGKTKEIDLSGFGDKAFVKIIKELDAPNISAERKFALINQIKGSRSPERKKALKELALKHKDEDVRSRSGLALVNAMLVNPEDADSDFLYEWTPRAVNDLDAGWALTALRLHFPDKSVPLEKRFIPVLLNILKQSEYDSSRSNAAELLGASKIKEAVPYLEEALMDKSSGTRSSALWALRNIFGKDYRPKSIHPDDQNLRMEIIYVTPRTK